MTHVRKLVRQGRNVLVWAALPCRPWCVWQKVNVSLGGETAKRICAERCESQQMLAVLAWTLQQVMQEQRGPHSGMLHALFEWPKAAYEQAANLPELARIQKLLGYGCRFDGCVYALTDAAGTPMRKPWRALTSLACLRKPLGRECMQLHDHAVTRGRAAIRSARYTAQLVEAVGRAVLAYPMRSVEAEEVGAPVRALDDGSGSGSIACKPPEVTAGEE